MHRLTNRTCNKPIQIRSRYASILAGNDVTSSVFSTLIPSSNVRTFVFAVDRDSLSAFDNSLYFFVCSSLIRT